MHNHKFSKRGLLWDKTRVLQPCNNSSLKINHREKKDNTERGQRSLITDTNSTSNQLYEEEWHISKTKRSKQTWIHNNKFRMQRDFEKWLKSQMKKIKILWNKRHQLESSSMHYIAGSCD